MTNLCPKLLLCSLPLTFKALVDPSPFFLSFPLTGPACLPLVVSWVLTVPWAWGIEAGLYKHEYCPLPGVCTEEDTYVRAECE